MRDLIDLVNGSQLSEAVGEALLYHGTDPQAAEAILHFGKIEGRTEHTAEHLVPAKGQGMRGFDMGFRPSDRSGYRGNVRGVSLTRDPRFARRWRSGDGVVFALDRTKIVHRHRLVKVAYFGHQRTLSGKDEAEEFLVGDLINVNDYIVNVEMTRKTYDELYEIDEQYPEDYDKPYLTLLRHPKLVVDDRGWHPATGVRIAA